HNHGHGLSSVLNRPCIQCLFYFHAFCLQRLCGKQLPAPETLEQERKHRMNLKGHPQKEAWNECCNSRCSDPENGSSFSETLRRNSLFIQLLFQSADQMSDDTYRMIDPERISKEQVQYKSCRACCQNNHSFLSTLHCFSPVFHRSSKIRT